LAIIGEEVSGLADADSIMSAELERGLSLGERQMNFLEFVVSKSQSLTSYPCARRADL